MKSSHCPKYERKNLKNSALSIQCIFFQIFRSYFGQWDDSRFFILKFPDLQMYLHAHMTYYSMTAKSESDCCQTDLHFDPNYQYDLSNEKEQIDAKRVHPNVHKIYSLGLYLCTNRYILDKSWKQHRWHLQSFHHCYRIGSHCSTGFPFTSMKAKGTKY